MANITLMGASYTDVPAVTLPQTGGGTVTFYENGSGGGASLSAMAKATTVTLLSILSAKKVSVRQSLKSATHPLLLDLMSLGVRQRAMTVCR